MWIEVYKTIYAVNVSLEAIEASKGLTATFKRRTKGELKTIRAWCYFNLVNMFGGVPVITDTDFKTNSLLPKEAPEQVFEFIINDLEGADTMLLADYPSAGRYRPNLYTSKALLAKAYLYTQNWEKAESFSDEVINAGIYSLEPDVNNVFVQGSTEAIWQYPGTDASFSHTNESYLFLPDAFNPGGVPKFEITPSLYDAFEEGDIRKANWIAAEDINGTIYNYPFKYKIRDASAAVTQEDYVFFRVAEQYLIRAEARAQLDQFDNALEDLNVIRRRAGISDLTFSDKQTLLDDILKERRLELFCEWGSRWFDLKRLNKADEVLGSKPNWQSTDVLYPIPLLELQRNPFLTQNPGY
jgi:starch-binding outer membrane protein, SusD/RagB family